MSWFLYSAEGLPSKTLQGKPRYTPEIPMWGGISLNLPEKEWTKFPENFYTTRHKDWRDRQGTRDHVAGEDLFKALKGRFSGRGIIFLDHEPTDEERALLEKEAHDTNLAYRMTCIEQYEAAVREKEVTGHGRTTPTPYEDECYSILGLTKPYSVEAMRAQRHPGEAVGEQIVAALERLEKRRTIAPPVQPIEPSVLVER